MIKKIFVLTVLLLVCVASVSYGAPRLKTKDAPVVKKEVSKPIIKPIAPPAIKSPRGSFDVGYFAGSAGAKLGLRLPKDILQMEPRIIVGYGIGQNYGVSLLQAELGNYTGNYNYGISVDVAGYSARVLGIPGLPAIIEPGSRLGVGVFAGTEILRQAVRIGYSSALGYTLLISKRF